MKIATRKSWGARAPRNTPEVHRTRQSPANVRELFIHWNGSSPRSFSHVNTVEEERSIMRGTQDFHMGPERGWADFAYSFAIFPSGRVYRGRGVDWVPAAQEGHNTNTVACIVYLGPDDEVNPEVRHAIRELRSYLQKRTGNHLRVRPHRAVVNTDCPGPRLTRFVTSLKD